jgi:hypothetical protein
MVINIDINYITLLCYCISLYNVNAIDSIGALFMLIELYYQKLFNFQLRGVFYNFADFSLQLN